MFKKNQSWLSEEVFPLWLDQGVDWERGGVIENLGPDGKARPADPRRALVLCRQLYSFRIGLQMGVASREVTLKAIERGAEALVRDFSGPSGSFVHSVDDRGLVTNMTPELYTQSFALFGLANAYAVLKSPTLKERALRLLEYLNAERRVSSGGFFEIGEGGRRLYLSNPHMHMFEAALAWMEFDSDSRWRSLADGVLVLCRERFIDSKTGLLAEFFDERWDICREGGRFIFEPGHQFEWSWLMGRYQRFTGENLTELRRMLFEQSEAHGVEEDRRVAWDQVWSDFEPKARSARFWPQAERIKAASQLSLDGVIAKDVGRRAAEEGMGVLWKYLETPRAGLWYDVWTIDNVFQPNYAKASSLYHIIGAMTEFEGLFDGQ